MAPPHRSRKAAGRPVRVGPGALDTADRRSVPHDDGEAPRMRIESISMARALAENIGHAIYWASPAGRREDGRGGWRAFTAEENRRAGARLGDLLNEWSAADPDGFAAFVAAVRAGDTGAEPATFATV